MRRRRKQGHPFRERPTGPPPIAVLELPGTGEFAANGRELAEALWLAAAMGRFSPPEGFETVGGTGGADDRDAPLPGSTRRGRSGPEDRSADVPMAHAGSGASTSDAWQEGQPGRLPLQVAAPRQIHEPLPLLRALRPLKHLTPSAGRQLLDEPATASRSAEAGAVWPVFLPLSERSLDLVVIADSGPSMVLWTGLATEVVALMRQVGAFRQISLWPIAVHGAKPAVGPGARRGSGFAARSWEGVSEHTVFLVVSDCAGPHWRNGAMAALLDRWGQCGPTAVVQPLPQRMWDRTAVRPRDMMLRAKAPRLANTLGLEIPLLSLAPDPLAMWSNLVAGNAGKEVWANAFSTADLAQRGSVDQVASGVSSSRGDTAEPIGVEAPPDTAVSLVTRFRSAASPEAFALAGALAAAPLNLPLMRVVQEVVQGERNSVHLAEVFLSGLLRLAQSADSRNRSEREFDLFDFVPGVREVLLGTVRRSEAARIVDLVSAWMHARIGDSGPTFTAFVPAGPDSAYSSAAAAAVVLYGTIPVSVLRRIGGAYADAALALDPWLFSTHTRTSNEEGSKVDVPQALERASRHESRQAARTQIAGPVESDDSTTRHAQASEQTSPLDSTTDKVEIALVGGAGSGKTTFLAALPVAVSQAGLSKELGSWSMTPNNTHTEDFQMSLVRLIEDQRFPSTTNVPVEGLSWTLRGAVGGTRLAVARPRRFLRRPKTGSELTTFTLRLSDNPGELFNSEESNQVFDALVRSQALVLLYDPLNDESSRTTYSMFGEMLRAQTRAAFRPGEVRNGRLPHAVAVCMTKFDEPRLLELAKLAGLVAQDAFGQPTVNAGDAEKFFDVLCRTIRSADTLRMVLQTFFAPDRIRFYVTTSVGFRRSDSGIGVHPADAHNVHNVGGLPRLRGRIVPVNVFEPIVELEQIVRANRLREERPARRRRRTGP